LKAGLVVDKIKEKTIIKNFNHYDHKCLYYLFSIRPISEEKLDVFETNTKYCHYDEVHKDYVYQESWVEFLVKIISEEKITRKQWKKKFKNKQKLNIQEYE